jgi:amidase
MKSIRLPAQLLALTLALTVFAPGASAATLDLTTATIADVQAAYKAGLTAEKLTAAYLARVAAYDKQGPTINTVITLNPNALAEAKALDAERKAGKVRGPLHGVPIVLKDNFDTFDLPTTGGSQMLEGSLPPDDAFVVKKLRAAGAIIVAKVNLSEWAGGGGSVSGATDPAVTAAGRVPNGFSSAGGQTRNPHDLTRGPAGSSGGTGAAIAAGFAQFGLGSDTGGSIRGPASVNGLAGLKPTIGLLSRDGIIPLALSFDTGGPIARSVYDVAVSLNIMTGVDKADAATAASAKYLVKDYTTFLKKGSLKGARIGVARDFFGQDPEVDRITEAAIAKLKELGAVVVDPVPLPPYFLQSRQSLLTLMMGAEFKVQITDYLKTTKAGFPKSFADLVALSNDPKTNYRSPEKAFGFKYQDAHVLDVTDPIFLAARDQGLPLMRSTIAGVLAKYQLDALVYPTNSRPAQPIKLPPGVPNPAGSPSGMANLTGFPDLIVPAGMTKDGLPVTLSFFGPAWSEPKLLAYGYDFEQATHARVLPKTTPSLPSDTISY